MRASALTILFALFGCSSSSVTNELPRVEAPAALDVREGESVTVTVKVADTNGDATTLSAGASADLRATLTPAAASPGSYALQVDATYEVGAHTVTLAVSDGKSNKQVTIDVRVARAKWASTWNFKSDGLEEREHPSVIFDASQDRILVIGGSGYKPQGKPLSDAYQIATKTGKATPLSLEGAALPAIASMRVAEIPGTQTAYLFGGYGASDVGGNKSYSDMYLADYSGAALKLTLLKQTAGPRARSLHGISYDEVSKRVFVFAGIDEKNAMLDDLWSGVVAGSEVTWTEHKPSEKPSKRYGFFFGQLNGRTLVYSGAQGTSSVKPARDLWALDTRSPVPTYTKLLEGESVPAGRRNGCFAVDRLRSRLWVFGGTPDAAQTLPGLWVYDARENIGKFSEVVRDTGPAIRSSGSGIVDPRDGSAYFGFGNDDDIYSDFTRLGY